MKEPAKKPTKKPAKKLDSNKVAPKAAAPIATLNVNKKVVAIISAGVALIILITAIVALASRSGTDANSSRPTETANTPEEWKKYYVEDCTAELSSLELKISSLESELANYKSRTGSDFNLSDPEIAVIPEGICDVEPKTKEMDAAIRTLTQQESAIDSALSSISSKLASLPLLEYMYKTEDGYSFTIKVGNHPNPTVTIDTANAKPGESTIKIALSPGTITVTNNTVGHNGRPPMLVIYPYYKSNILFDVYYNGNIGGISGCNSLGQISSVNLDSSGYRIVDGSPKKVACTFNLFLQYSLFSASGEANSLEPGQSANLVLADTGSFRELTVSEDKASDIAAALRKPDGWILDVPYQDASNKDYTLTKNKSGICQFGQADLPFGASYLYPIAVASGDIGCKTIKSLSN